MRNRYSYKKQTLTPKGWQKIRKLKDNMIIEKGKGAWNVKVDCELCNWSFDGIGGKGKGSEIAMEHLVKKHIMVKKEVNKDG